MKRLGKFQLPPLDGMLVYTFSRITPSIKFAGLCGERHCGSKVSGLRTQHNVLSQDLNLDCLIQR